MDGVLSVLAYGVPRLLYGVAGTPYYRPLVLGPIAAIGRQDP